MKKEKNDSAYKKFLVLLIGFFVTVLGVFLILLWWDDVCLLFRAGLGLILALAGLFALYAASKM